MARHSTGGSNQINSGGGRFEMAMMKQALHAGRLEDLDIQVAVFESGAQKMHLCVNRIPASGGAFTAFDLAELFGRGPVDPAEGEPGER